MDNETNEKELAEQALEYVENADVGGEKEKTARETEGKKRRGMSLKATVAILLLVLVASSALAVVFALNDAHSSPENVMKLFSKCMSEDAESLFDVLTTEELREVVTELKRSSVTDAEAKAKIAEECSLLDRSGLLDVLKKDEGAQKFLEKGNKELAWRQAEISYKPVETPSEKQREILNSLENKLIIEDSAFYEIRIDYRGEGLESQTAVGTIVCVRIDGKWYIPALMLAFTGQALSPV